MAYSTATEVKYIINTSVADATITNMITIADAELDNMLNGSTMDSNVKKGCSMRLTALMLAQRDPEIRRFGGTDFEMKQRLTDWKTYVDEQVRMAKSYIDEA